MTEPKYSNTHFHIHGTKRKETPINRKEKSIAKTRSRLTHNRIGVRALQKNDDVEGNQ